MKSFFKLSTLLFSISLIIFSCSTTNDELKMIPKNALVIVHVNLKSLAGKLSWEDIKQTNWFKEIKSDTAMGSWAKKLMDAPGNSGIDFSTDLIIFAQKAPGTQGQIVIEGELKDAKAFEEFNKNLDEKSVIVKDEDIKMLAIEKSFVGWNAKKFAYVISSPFIATNKNFTQDSLNTNTTPVDNVEKLSATCKNLFALHADSSMSKIDRFSGLLKEDGDIHVWQNNEEMVKSSAQMGMLNMVKLDAFLKGNISTAIASFNTGKIDVRQKLYVSKELADLLKKYGGTGVNTDMIKNIPSQNLLAVLVANFKPEGIREIIKLTGMDGFLNIFLSEQGLTLDDFVKANKGDIMFAVTDLIVKSETLNFRNEEDRDSSYTYSKPGANFLFSLSIGDKPSFDKLMSTGKKIGEQMSNNLGIYFAGNDKFFAIGNSRENVSKYIAGSNNKFDFIDKIANHPIGIFVDIQKILSAASSQPMNDSGAKVIMDESIKTWQNLYAMGGEYKEEAFIMNSEINLIDKNTNSLKQLNSYFDKISKVLIEKNKNNKERWAKAGFTIYPPLSALGD